MVIMRSVRRPVSRTASCTACASNASVASLGELLVPRMVKLALKAPAAAPVTSAAGTPWPVTSPMRHVQASATLVEGVAEPVAPVCSAA